MPHWKSLQGKDFLGSWDFEQGEEKIVTIKNYRSEIIENPANPSAVKKPKVVLGFEEVKPYPMNTTNCTMISEVLGSPDLDDWIGKQIVLHVEKVRGFGKIVDAIRVMDKLPEKYVCADCSKEIVAVGNWSAKQLADRSAMEFGVCLCVNCAKTRTEAAKNDETDA